ncbi:Lrp/AsnC family transcriptional regulator [Streptomyces sp. bgisy091]|uniref:Lrp/AsnC family transcriptional regulator n=1 Tax=Streptomyces sp. bgisy091 TaxID=3413778 RepID=UPI003D760116
MTPPIPPAPSLDGVDRALLRLLARDARATYQELGQAVRLSANATAERVRRLRREGAIQAYTVDIDPGVHGHALFALTDVKLREGVDRRHFEESLAELEHVIRAAHVTGEYDYQLTLGCRDTADLETAVDRLKDSHGVREVNSRVVLSEVTLDPLRTLV